MSSIKNDFKTFFSGVCGFCKGYGYIPENGLACPRCQGQGKQGVSFTRVFFGLLIIAGLVYLGYAICKLV